MGILSWILVGLVAGWLAELVMKGAAMGSWDIILGISALWWAVSCQRAVPVLGMRSAGFNLTTLVVAFWAPS
jgi:uncharacterized membrane protein YeaQ/YmgE (transglycosylase-associated protein family)